MDCFIHINRGICYLRLSSGATPANLLIASNAYCSLFNDSRVIRDVHEEADASDSSSDSDDDWSVRKSHQSIFKADSPDEKNVQPTFGPKQHAVRSYAAENSDQRSVAGKYCLTYTGRIWLKLKYL